MGYTYHYQGCCSPLTSSIDWSSEPWPSHGALEQHHGRPALVLLEAAFWPDRLVDVKGTVIEDLEVGARFAAKRDFLILFQIAGTLAKILGNSAGAFTSALDYKTQLGKEFSHKSFIKDLRSLPSPASAAVRVCEMVYERLKSKDADTADLMLLTSIFDIQSIPHVFFSRHQDNQQIPLLVDYGIMEPTQDREVFSIPGIIGSCTKSWLQSRESEKSRIEELALSVLAQKFTGQESDILVPCALAALRFQPNPLEGSHYQAALLFQLSQHYIRLDQNDKALQHLGHCLSIRE